MDLSIGIVTYNGKGLLAQCHLDRAAHRFERLRLAALAQQDLVAGDVGAQLPNGLRADPLRPIPDVLVHEAPELPRYDMPPDRLPAGVQFRPRLSELAEDVGQRRRAVNPDEVKASRDMHRGLLAVDEDVKRSPAPGAGKPRTGHSGKEGRGSAGGTRTRDAQRASVFEADAIATMRPFLFL